jgi:malonyl CoA-acyl carrier protein transacylase
VSEKPIVFMFSGQGSQYFQMGKALYEQHRSFRHHMDQLDVIARDLCGHSIVAMLYEEGREKGARFNRTLFSQPAIYMVEHSLVQVLLAAGVSPAMVLGTSLGTYAAAVVAGCWDSDTALVAAIKGAVELEERCHKGGMIAVLADPALFDRLGLREYGELAALNFHSHFAIAAPIERLPTLESILRKENVTFQTLDVSYAFHSKWIDPAQTGLRDHLRTLQMQPPRLPLICCASAAELPALDDQSLWNVTREPIRFGKTLEYLERKGAYRYVDVGPSGTLATLLKHALPKTSVSESYSILSPFGKDLERLEAVITQLGSKSRVAASGGSAEAADPRPTSVAVKEPNDAPRVVAPAARASEPAPVAGPTRAAAVKRAFVFPGQGSQKRGMGQDLFDKTPEFVGAEREIDAILGYSVRKLCIEDPHDQLKQTQFTQPCLYIVNALHWYQAVARGEQASHVAGHSLGEYNALLAAGVFDFLTGLRLVKRRGELMSQAKNGGMAAVVGLTSEQIQQLLREHELTGIDLANYNSPQQTVISCPVADIKRAEPVFTKGGARLYVQLPVSAAFHSRYMEPSARAFAEYLNPFTFGAPRVPIIANATAQPYQPDSIKALLAQQIDHSVMWTQSVRLLLQAGVGEFKELGPGNVLTQLVAQIQRAPA